MSRQPTAGEFQPILAHGPKVEYVPAALIADLQGAGSIAPSGNYTSPLFSADGYYDMVVALTSSQAGAINLLRYVDDARAVLLDATAPTQALTAATPGVLIVTDGKPFASYQVKVSNSSGSTAATLSNIAALTSAH
jgi:hypothetical protein